MGKSLRKVSYILMGGAVGALQVALPVLGVAFGVVGVVLFLLSWFDDSIETLFKTRPIPSAIAALVLGVIALIGTWKAYSYDTRPLPPPTPKLMVQCSKVNLPVKIEPRSTAYILQVHPKIDAGLFIHDNRGSSVVSWPGSIASGDLEPMYVCSFTNNEPYNLTAVSVQFGEQFFNLKLNSSSYRVNPDGTATLTFSHNSGGGDASSYAWVQDGISVSVTTGDLVATVASRTVVFPTIAASNKQVMYIINMSRLIAAVTRPMSASGYVTGYAQPVSIQLLQPIVNMLDIPPLRLGPSTHEWKGLPTWP